MERNIQQPLTLPKHPELLEDIVNMQIAINAWYINLDRRPTAATAGLKDRNPEPKWPDILDLLNRSYKAINEQREDPRKY